MCMPIYKILLNSAAYVGADDEDSALEQLGKLISNNEATVVLNVEEVTLEELQKIGVALTVTPTEPDIPY